jgi:GNAT superfamily N-acetyltransferase
MSIREFTPHDYPALARIANAAFPEYPSTAEETEFDDAHRDPKCRHQRWVIEQDGHMVAFGGYSQRANAYHPRRFNVDVTVHPGWQGKGLGKALYEQVIAELTPFDPLSVRAHTREDMTRSVRFLHDRGFTEDMRSFESRLDVAAFDPSPYADVELPGIEFQTLRELEHIPGHWEKHYALSRELNADVPSPEPYTPVAKDLWLQRLEENPGLLRDGYFFAVHHGEYVGLTMLRSTQGNSDLYTGLTGVKRDFRRQGIALALKLKAIAWAKAQGHPLIKTWNESNNRGMLGINERLGFVRQPAWLDMVKKLKEDTP